MPLSEGYGILKGIALKGKAERKDKKSPHYQILLEANSAKYRVPINVRSIQEPFDLLVKIILDFQHPITDQLTQLPSGFTEVPLAERKSGGISLDYIRMNLVKKEEMQAVRSDLSGRDNDLNDLLEGIILPILKDSLVDLYAFGEPWGPEAQKKDKIFGFQPGQGLHNIHMNQGNQEVRFAQENGVYQDGALFFHLKEENRWIAYFSAFQSQLFHTDDLTGNPLDNQGQPVQPSTDVEQPLPSASADIKIIAALVNPIGDDVGQEIVTILNTTANSIILEGWSLADRIKRKIPLSGSLDAGQTLQIKLSRDNIQLGNEGGIITVLNPQGLKVDGVSYTKESIRGPGQTIVF